MHPYYQSQYLFFTVQKRTYMSSFFTYTLQLVELLFLCFHDQNLWMVRMEQPHPIHFNRYPLLRYLED